jgi:hypothetical protein
MTVESFKDPQTDKVELYSDMQLEVIESIIYLLMVCIACGTLIYVVETGKTAARETVAIGKAGWNTLTAPVHAVSKWWSGTGKSGTGKSGTGKSG